MGATPETFMRVPRPSALLPAVAVLALAAAARAGEAPKSPWHGFGPGSTVHRKMTTTTTMGGMAMPPQVIETRDTLVSQTDAEVVVKSEQKMGEMPWQSQETKIPLGQGALTGVEAPKEEDLGKDKVTVEGKEYEVAKKRVVTPVGTNVFWIHEKHGLLKSEGTVPGGGKTVVSVTRLAVPVKVGERTLTCRETRTTSSGAAQGMDMDSTMLTSEEVPGGLVRMEMKTTMQGMVSSAVTETVSFEKK
jgi:hypothetical protein